jgi:hypothetical protein
MLLIWMPYRLPAALPQGQASRLAADTTPGPGLALPRSERPPGVPHFGEVRAPAPIVYLRLPPEQSGDDGAEDLRELD